MGDEDWNHRSNFKGPRDPAVNTVTAAVNTRREGPIGYPTPEELTDEAQESGGAGDSEHEEAVQEGFADKWEKRFSHLPGVDPSGDQ